MKNKTRKLIRNILISAASLLVVAFILNTAPGYKRDKLKEEVKLIIHDENVTEDLKNKVYIDENENVYLSRRRR